MTKAAIIKLIIMYAHTYGVNPELAISVAQIESNFNSNAVGQAKEVGLFQLKPEYVKEYSRKQLFDPRINIKVGVQRLAETQKNCLHKQNNDFLVCWNYGYSNAKRVKHPSLFPYVKRVTLAMKNYGQN